MARSNGDQPLVQHFQAEFQDFDVLARAISGWDLDWQQLDRGPLEARVQQLMTPCVLLSRADFSRRYHQQGATPPGFLTFGCLRSDMEDLSWCGQPAGVGHLLAFRPGGDFESFSPPDFGCYTMSFSEELLEREARICDLPGIGSKKSWVNRVLDVDPEALSRLRNRLRALYRAAGTDSSVTAVPAFRREIESGVAGEVLRVLTGGQPANARPTSALRDRSARRSLELIRDRPRDPLTVRDLCEAAQVSERTLRYAFHELYGVSPKQYLQAHRLNGVRRDLRNFAARGRVADVANRWGFWHMGQFAADYRRQFGELPSKTLARRR
jgi:AraC family ethanolamine operon transcriptional activator